MHTAVKWQGPLRVSGFFRRRVDRLLSLVDHLGSCLFYLADSLISLSLSANLSLSVNAPAASLIRPFTSSLLPDMIFVLRFAENKAAHRLPDNRVSRTCSWWMHSKQMPSVTSQPCQVLVLVVASSRWAGTPSRARPAPETSCGALETTRPMRSSLTAKPNVKRPSKAIPPRSQLLFQGKRALARSMVSSGQNQNRGPGFASGGAVTNCHIVIFIRAVVFSRRGLNNSPSKQGNDYGTDFAHHHHSAPRRRIAHLATLAKLGLRTERRARIDSDYPARPRCNGTNPARLLVLCGTLCIPLGFASEPMREGKPGLAYGLIPADVELLNAVIVGVDDV